MTWHVQLSSAAQKQLRRLPAPALNRITDVVEDDKRIVVVLVVAHRRDAYL